MVMKLFVARDGAIVIKPPFRVPKSAYARIVKTQKKKILQIIPKEYTNEEDDG